jgi:hypothetical protein
MKSELRVIKSTKKSKAGQSGLPQFLIEFNKEDEFVLCFEVKGRIQKFISLNPPSMDVRFKREMKENGTSDTDELYSLRKSVQVWDRGNYTIGSKKDKGTIEEVFLQSLDKGRIGLTLNGEKLQGRFIIKHDPKIDSYVIYKQKDKFAKVEDVLSSDLIRSVSKMVPDYDPKKIKIPKGTGKSKGKEKMLKDSASETFELINEDEEETGIDRFSKTISKKNYQFQFFDGDLPETDLHLCLIKGEDGSEIVMQSNDKMEWQFIESTPVPLKRKKAEFKKAILEILSDK